MQSRPLSRRLPLLASPSLSTSECVQLNQSVCVFVFVCRRVCECVYERICLRVRERAVGAWQARVLLWGGEGI